MGIEWLQDRDRATKDQFVVDGEVMGTVDGPLGNGYYSWQFKKWIPAKGYVSGRSRTRTAAKNALKKALKMWKGKQDNPGQLQIVVPKGTPVKLLNAPKGTRISRKTIQTEVRTRTVVRSRVKKRRNPYKETFYKVAGKRFGDRQSAVRYAKSEANLYRRPQLMTKEIHTHTVDGIKISATNYEIKPTRRNSGTISKRKNTSSPMRRVAKRVKRFNPDTRHGVYVGSNLAYVSSNKLDANKAASKLKLSGRVGIKIKQVKPNPISGKLPKVGWREQYKKAAYAAVKAPAKRRKRASTTAKIRRTIARKKGR